MADPPPEAADERALLTNVSKTLTTAMEVLTHLENALIRSGFSGSIASYQSMCDVVLGQRLWSVSRAMPQLQAQFAQVATKATAIYSILVPYAEMMKRLSALESIDSTLSTVPEPAMVLEEQMVEILRNHRAPTDLYTLQRATRADGRTVRKAIAALVDRGVVDSRQVGGRTLYALTVKKHPGAAPPA